MAGRPDGVAGSKQVVVCHSNLSFPRTRSPDRMPELTFTHIRVVEDALHVR